MEGIPLNWWAVIVAAVVKFVIGWLWYAPFLFGKRWQQLSGINDMSGMAPAIAFQIAGDLVMAYILGRFIVHYLEVVTLTGGAIIGFMAWLGFVAPIMIGAMFYEKRSGELVAINSGYQLVGIVVMGAILGV